MLLLLGSLLAGAEEPALSIVVSDSPYEEIYMEEPRVICTVPCMFEQDSSLIFVEANRNHHTWFRSGKVSAIYNQETVQYTYKDCDFKKNALMCAHENNLWVLRTTIAQDSESASINLVLLDENAVPVGQSSIAKFKKTTIIERKKVTHQQLRGQAMETKSCDEESGNCTTLPIQMQGQSVRQTEDLQPVVIDIPPSLTARDINQAMIMLYDSVR